MEIEGLDISTYQGNLTAEIVAQMISKGIRWVQVRVGQGSGYKDPRAENNIKLLQAAGLPVGPYHFCTNDNATLQYNNFVANCKDFQFELLPWIDCEAYAGINGEAYAVRDLYKLTIGGQLRSYLSGIEQDNLFALQEATLYGYEAFEAKVDEVYGLTYPASAVVDSLGRQMINGWMKTQTKLTYSPNPAIYTNRSSGNTIFGSNVYYSKYPLAVANWGVVMPYLPAAWVGKPYYTWQNGVIDAAPYGIDSLKVDHDLWGDQFPFPGETPPPPPPPPPSEEWIEITSAIHHPSGKVFSGRLDPEA